MSSIIYQMVKIQTPCLKITSYFWFSVRVTHKETQTQDTQGRRRNEMWALWTESWNLRSKPRKFKNTKVKSNKPGRDRRANRWTDWRKWVENTFFNTPGGINWWDAGVFRRRAVKQTKTGSGKWGENNKIKQEITKTTFFIMFPASERLWNWCNTYSLLLHINVYPVKTVRFGLALNVSYVPWHAANSSTSTE